MTNEIAEFTIKVCYVKNGPLDFNLWLASFVSREERLVHQCGVPLMTGLQQTYILLTNKLWGL